MSKFSVTPREEHKNISLGPHEECGEKKIVFYTEHHVLNVIILT